MRFLRLAAGVLLLAAAPLAWAGDDFESLQKEFREAQQTWYQKYAEAQKEAGEDKPVDQSKLPPRPEKEFRAKFKALADKLAGKPDAIAPLVWLVNNAEAAPGEKDETATEALATLTKSHAADKEIAAQLPQLMYTYWRVGAEPLNALYEKVIKENPDKDAKAAATFNLAFTLYSSDRGGKPGGSAGRDRAIALFKSMATDFPDSKAAKRAESYVFEIENLQIGMKAPDFSGEDADGKTIKLSDFKGKVVVIDFWGFW